MFWQFEIGVVVLFFEEARQHVLKVTFCLHPAIHSAIKGIHAECRRGIYNDIVRIEYDAHQEVNQLCEKEASFSALQEFWGQSKVSGVPRRRHSQQASIPSARHSHRPGSQSGVKSTTESNEQCALSVCTERTVTEARTSARLRERDSGSG